MHKIAGPLMMIQRDGRLDDVDEAIVSEDR